MLLPMTLARDAGATAGLPNLPLDHRVLKGPPLLAPNHRALMGPLPLVPDHRALTDPQPLAPDYRALPLRLAPDHRVLTKPLPLALDHHALAGPLPLAPDHRALKETSYCVLMSLLPLAPDHRAMMGPPTLPPNRSASMGPPTLAQNHRALGGSPILLPNDSATTTPPMLAASNGEMSRQNLSRLKPNQSPAAPSNRDTSRLVDATTPPSRTLALASTPPTLSATTTRRSIGAQNRDLTPNPGQSTTTYAEKTARGASATTEVDGVASDRRGTTWPAMRVPNCSLPRRPNPTASPTWFPLRPDGVVLLQEPRARRW